MAGQRFHPSYTRVGGLMVDVKDDWVEKIRSFIKNDFPKAHADITRLLNRNKIFIDRTKRPSWHCNPDRSIPLPSAP